MAFVVNNVGFLLHSFQGIPQASHKILCSSGIRVVYWACQLPVVTRKFQVQCVFICCVVEKIEN